MRDCPNVVSGNHDWHPYQHRSDSTYTWFHLICSRCDLIDDRVSCGRNNSESTYDDVLKRILKKQAELEEK